MQKYIKMLLWLCVSLVSLGAAEVLAQPTPVMKQFSQFPGGGQGLYWVPSSGPISHIAFLAIHRTSDFLAHVSTQELPRRGNSCVEICARKSLVRWIAKNAM